MRIDEIIQPQEIERSLSTPFNVQKMGKRPNYDTGGAYATGTKDPGDPHLYRKKLRMPSDLANDAYYQYIKECSPYMKSNPYFPRVYKVIFRKFKQGYIKPEYHIESLLTIDEANKQVGAEELLNIICEKVYDEVHLASRLEQYADTGLSIRTVLWDIERVAGGRLPPSIFKDEKLNEAIQLIQVLKESNPVFSFDMHEGNFMVRFGPGGPQLVITDPLADGGKSIAAGWDPFRSRMVNAPSAAPTRTADIPFE